MTDTDTRNVSASGFDLSPPSGAERKHLEATLTREERDVLLHHGTEAPFCGGLLDNKTDGVYCCRLCGLPLFQAKTKFESGTGWPSFFAPFDEAHVTDVKDTSYGMVRLRYCINSISLSFVANGMPLPDPLGRGDHLR